MDFPDHKLQLYYSLLILSSSETQILCPFSYDTPPLLKTFSYTYYTIANSFEQHFPYI